MGRIAAAADGTTFILGTEGRLTVRLGDGTEKAVQCRPWVALEGAEMLLNGPASRLAVYNEKDVSVVHLPPRHVLHGPYKEFVCPVKHAKLTHINQILWHPLSPMHLCLLTNEHLRLYNVSKDLEWEDLIETDRATSFCFGGSSGWGPFSVLLSAPSGSFGLLCPLVVNNCSISRKHYEALWASIAAIPSDFSRKTALQFLSQFSLEASTGMYRIAQSKVVQSPSMQSLAFQSKGEASVHNFSLPFLHCVRTQTTGTVEVFASVEPVLPRWDHHSPTLEHKIMKIDSVQVHAQQMVDVMVDTLDPRIAVVREGKNLWAVPIRGLLELAQLYHGKHRDVVLDELASALCVDMKPSLVKGAMYEQGAVFCRGRRLDLLCESGEVTQVQLTDVFQDYDEVPITSRLTTLHPTTRKTIEGRIPPLDVAYIDTQVQKAREQLQRNNTEEAISFIEEIQEQLHALLETVPMHYVSDLSEQMEDLDACMSTLGRFHSRLDILHKNLSLGSVLSNEELRWARSLHASQKLFEKQKEASTSLMNRIHIGTENESVQEEDDSLLLEVRRHTRSLQTLRHDINMLTARVQSLHLQALPQ